LLGIAAGLTVLVLFCCASLLTMSICTWVIISVTFEKVYNTPCAQTCAQGDHKDLQSINRACKKCHNVPPLISEILICDMAVSGRKQKKPPHCFRKKSVSNSTAAWGRKNPAVIYFSGRITNPQKILLSS
jgi:hypothetical protein